MASSLMPAPSLAAISYPIVSPQGFSIENGANDTSENEYWLKRVFIKNSRNRYLLCDTSKLDKVFLYRTAPLSAFTEIITESPEVNARIKKGIATDRSLTTDRPKSTPYCDALANGCQIICDEG
jgi:DeoR/GlpR family transcriptional regulator of sugar metabolism